MRVFPKLSCLLLVLGVAAGAAHAQQAKLTPAEREAKARDYFTDTRLKTQADRTVRFYSDALKGKVVLMNFVFTQCGDACPLITAKLVQAKNELGDAFGRSASIRSTTGRRTWRSSRRSSTRCIPSGCSSPASRRTSKP
jgi:protein SCO1/2